MGQLLRFINVLVVAVGAAVSIGLRLRAPSPFPHRPVLSWLRNTPIFVIIGKLEN